MYFATARHKLNAGKIDYVATAVNLELTLNNHHTTLPRKKIRFFTTHFYRGKS